jgi:hypothetical protein
MTDEKEQTENLAFRRRQLKSMARSYTGASIKRLSGYVLGPDVDDHLAMEAIKILLDRGYGRPKGEKIQKHVGHDGGAINVQINYPPRDESK